MYTIRRYDLKGFCYGEVIYSDETVKGCLAYLKDAFKINPWIRLEREGFTFTKYTTTNVFHYAINQDLQRGSTISNRSE